MNLLTHLHLHTRPHFVRTRLQILLTLSVLSTALFVQAEEFPLLPYGTVAAVDMTAAKTQDEPHALTTAWYSCATQRYRHGVLGDDIEGGCLIATSADGKQYDLQLLEQYVFEDVTPRLADMDGDGQADIVTVRSDSSQGAALVIYSLRDGELKEIASTPPIGLSNRWLAPAGIADFNDDGINDIAYVQTPHIGGILRFWSITNDGFIELGKQRGFSNHSIGATRVSISRVDDFNGDGVDDIALPDQSGASTVIMTLHPRLHELKRQAFELSFFD